MDEKEPPKRHRRSRAADMKQTLDLTLYPNALLNVEQVSVITGLGVSTIWHLVREGLFPEPKRLTRPRQTVWVASDIDAYLRHRALQPA